jgi:hypothetical protein
LTNIKKDEYPRDEDNKSKKKRKLKGKNDDNLPEEDNISSAKPKYDDISNADNLDDSNRLDDDEIKRKLKYYEEKDNKYGPSTKDYYELNKDRYNNDLWDKDDKDNNDITPKKSKKDEKQKPKEINKRRTKSGEKDTKDRPDSSAQKKRIKRGNRSAEKRPLKKNLKDLDNLNDKEPIMKCSDCGKKDKNLTNYCDNCDGPICKDCKKSHLKKNPNHKFNPVKPEHLKKVPKNKGVKDNLKTKKPEKSQELTFDDNKPIQCIDCKKIFLL